jgi:hypothetical protein
VKDRQNDDAHQAGDHTSAERCQRYRLQLTDLACLHSRRYIPAA